ncbi:hypothetical protein GOBAR_AA40490 [Gossypium barbadense]|uniref:Uncharacterized protein n=1 Tax=Gossypium barbadense TaxID=3634 RepID=A0A2P5VN06_GOSBA|nr:hypothetical protein GOBAR_AA40490 [Gossypium barbadense]
MFDFAFNLHLFNQCHTFLHVDSEPKDAFKTLKQTSRMSDLISQTDQLLSKWQMQDYLELLMIPSADLVAVTWCDEQLHMATTVSNHVFRLYAKEIDAIGSNLGFERRVDFSQEITMPLSRVLGHGARTSSTSVDGRGLDMSTSKCELPVKRDVKSCLFNIIKTSRLLADMDSTKRRRRRGARHYLSTRAVILSPEDVSLLDQYNFTGKLSSNV